MQASYGCLIFNENQFEVCNVDGMTSAENCKNDHKIDVKQVLNVTFPLKYVFASLIIPRKVKFNI